MNLEYKIYMMHVNDSANDYLENSMCIVFGYTTLNSMQRVLVDRRSVYTKFKNQKRYYKDYMEVYRYTDPGDNKNYNPRLNVFIKLMDKVTGEKSVNESMNLMIIKHKLLYGDVVINRVDKSIIERVLLKDPLEQKAGPVLVPEQEQVLTSAEKRKLSRKKYEDSIREKLRQKSKDYYAANKEILREKRLAKEAAAAEN
jgi:hypothetical protein